MNRAERRSLAKRQKKKKPRAGKTALGAAVQELKGALAHHQAGRLEEAETGCRQVLQSDPDNPAALHLLGLIACQTGSPGAAEPLIVKALALAPLSDVGSVPAAGAQKRRI